MDKKDKPTAVKKELQPDQTDFSVIKYSPVNKAIWERFKIIRSQAGLTQAEFAKSLEITLPYVKGVEQGRFLPSHEVLARIAKVYKRSMDWIYGLRD